MRHPSRSKLFAFAVALAVTSQLCSAPIANAQSNTHGTTPRATPANHPVDGFTGGQLLGQLSAVFYTAPVGTVGSCLTLVSC
jgi:hypothetical protein